WLQRGKSNTVELADEDFGRVQSRRQQELRVRIREVEARREDADDLVRLAIEREEASDDQRVAAEFPLPVPVGQHDALGALWRVVFRGEAAAERRLDPEDRENPVAHLAPHDPLPPSPAP